MAQTTHQGAVRKLSGLLFGGAEHRLEIAAAIGDNNGIANTIELAEKLGFSRQTVNHQLGKLEQAGLLQRVESAERKVYLVAIDCSIWSTCQQLRDRAQEILDAVPRY